MRKTVLIIIFFFTLFYSHAQNGKVKQVVHQIEQLLYVPDTAWFDDEKISYARFYENGNVELSNIIDKDTTRFNLHLLHAIYLDKDSTFNKFGLHLSESSVQLFLDPIMNEIGLDENGELISKGSVLTFYNITLRSPAEAKQLADALINLRSLTKTDDKLFIRQY